jgi:hypothetical protein
MSQEKACYASPFGNSDCHSSVSAVTSFRPDDWVQIPSRGMDYSLHQQVQSCPRAHRELYPVGTMGCFPKGYSSWSMKLIHILSRVTCRGGGGCLMKIVGSSFDDWIYWHFIYNLS